MRNSDWSLVLFTVLVQMVAGCFISIGIAYQFFFFKNENGITHQLVSRFLIAIFSILLLALLISFLHLGSPKNSIYALKNISSSWLSRELLFVSLFTLLLGIFSFLFYKENISSQSRNILGAVTALTGIFAVYSMSRLYMLDTVPVWNNFATPVQFFSTAFILGAVSIAAGLFLISGQLKPSAEEILHLDKIVKSAVIAALIFITVQLIVWLYHLYFLSGSSPAAKTSYLLIVNEYAPLFYLQTALALLSVCSLVYFLINTNRNISDPKLLFASFFFIFFSEIIGRYLFYSAFARTGV